MLGLLTGHRRYAHITALRGDAVAAQTLGMNKIISEDALRRALGRIDEAASTAWMMPMLMHSVRPALDKPWVLDMDATIKPVYGRQEGAELEYNPAKSGRPSHVLHTFWVGSGQLWEYAVMVTDVNYPLEAIGQLYRDRADCENGFDELKNQWGLSGFTTQDINRCQTTARACALVYNWWSWYCRAANPGARMEAITSRPLLLSALGTVAHHGGQTTLYLTPINGKTHALKSLIANIYAAIRHIKNAAEQFKADDRWALLLRYVSNKMAPKLSPFPPSTMIPATG
jgi:hypothetical protein